MRAILALEDGFILEGVSFTGPIELTGGEVIFNRQGPGRRSHREGMLQGALQLAFHRDPA